MYKHLLVSRRFIYNSCCVCHVSVFQVLCPSFPPAIIMGAVGYHTWGEVGELRKLLFAVNCLVRCLYFTQVPCFGTN